MQRHVDLSSLRGRLFRGGHARITVVGLVLSIPFATPIASASDGVREIDAACAASGCFSGDSPGLPVTIDGTAGRSYRLTSDLLSVSGTPTSMIEIDASEVTLDLGGYWVGGSTPDDFSFPCEFERPSVGIAGSGVGVEIRNGSVVCADAAGVMLSGGQTRLRSVRIGNVASGTAVVLGEASLVSGLRALGEIGTPPLAARMVELGPGSLIEHSRIEITNSAVALRVEPGSAIRFNVLLSGPLSASTLPTGIETPEDSLIAMNLLLPFFNPNAVGIAAGAGIAVLSNSINSAPIQIGSECHLEGNLIQNTWPLSQLAVDLGNASTFRENRITVEDPLANPMTGSLFLNMGDNACSGPKADCP